MWRQTDSSSAISLLTTSVISMLYVDLAVQQFELTTCLKVIKRALRRYGKLTSVSAHAWNLMILR